MATPFSLPTNWEQAVEFILPDKIWEKGNFNSDPLFKKFPISTSDAAEIHWDQYINVGGLMPGIAPRQHPDVVPLPGVNTFKVKPGAYALEAILEAEEIEKSRQPNTVNEPLNVEDRLGKIMLDCSTLMVNRFHQTMGILVTSGIIENTNTAGQITHRYVVPNFQVFTPNGIPGQTGPGWSANPAAATPISDLIYWQRNLLEPGTSANFGKESYLSCNPITINTLWNCQQIQQILKDKFGATYKIGEGAGSTPPVINGDNSINALMMSMGLPDIVVDKRGYWPDAASAAAQTPGLFKYRIPNNTFTWIGERPEGAPIGAMKLTRNPAVKAFGSEKYPRVEVENKEYAELSKAIFVIVDYHKLIPVHYTLQMAVYMAPLIAYYRGVAGIRTG
jgi:hypothetical protein